MDQSVSASRYMVSQFTGNNEQEANEPTPVHKGILAERARTYLTSSLFSMPAKDSADNGRKIRQSVNIDIELQKKY